MTFKFDYYSPYLHLVTGIKTNSDYNPGNLGFENVVAVKTHYPDPHNPNNFDVLDEKYFERAIVILRNPINAIPSEFNQAYGECM